MPKSTIGINVYNWYLRNPTSRWNWTAKMNPTGLLYILHVSTIICSWWISWFLEKLIWSVWLIVD